MASPLVAFSVVATLALAAAASPERSDGESPAQDAHASPPPGAPANIVFLLFDSTSYTKVFSDGQVVARLPNFKALAEESLVFHDARSLPGHTIRNVPTLMTGWPYAESPGVAELKGKRSLFDIAYERDYRLIVFGSYIRYCTIFVRDRGLCRSDSYGINTHPRNFVEAFGAPYRRAVAGALPYPQEIWLRQKLGGTLFGFIEGGLPVRAQVNVLHRDLLNTLRDIDHTFVYAHYMIPHLPYARYDRASQQIEWGTTYQESLEAMDVVLGQVVQTLRQSGAWEDTLLIVTSDHNEASETDDSRVPLILKLPGMTHRVDFRGPWSQDRLFFLMEELFRRGAFDGDTVLDAVRSISQQTSTAGVP